MPKHRLKTLGLTILRNSDGNPNFALVDQDTGEVVNGVHALTTGQDVTTAHGFIEVAVRMTVELLPPNDGQCRCDGSGPERPRRSG